MNTERLYVSQLSVVEVDQTSPLKKSIILTFRNYKHVIIRQSKFKPGIFYDLKKTGRFYTNVSASRPVGTKCLNPNETKPFNKVVGNKKKYLSKKKVLKLYDNWLETGVNKNENK